MPIPSLTPRGPGHRFIAYGDCCSGTPGGPHEKIFASLNAVIQRLDPRPEFILFPGDHIFGSIPDADTLRAQWRYFFDHEMAWLDRGAVPIYSTTSNHNTYSPMSEAMFREIFPDIPRNGPPDQLGLSYWVRRGDLLVVAANTSFTGLGGNGHVETAWLDRVLADHADAKHKLVTAHYPVWPVNGYGESPLWRIVPDEGRAFWVVLVRHRVTAYVCSHVIAFDAQAHDGVLQLTTGGAGTIYGPGGFMDGPGEYHHLVEGVLDADGLRCRTLDTTGAVREELHWRAGAGLSLRRLS
ncbi:MAG: hypothetical protein K8S99_12735 [Planctomycetes bacterium]|nr:hypothetical protein [Planctomycetota bacterium]